MAQKLTRWFPARIKPARKGVYETYDSNLGESYFNLWDGKRWFYGFDDLSPMPTRAWRADEWEDNAKSLLKWRGLAKEPK